MIRNVAGQLIAVQLISATDGSDVLTGTTAVDVEIDGVAGAGGTATFVVGSKGKWEFSPIQSDTNGAHLTFQFSQAGAVSVLLNVYTHFPQTVDNNVLAAGANGFAAIKAETALVVADTNELQTDWADAGRLDAILDARMPTTHINATTGAVDTVTTLTNLPAITTNWLTATGIETGALDGKGDWNIGKTGYSLTVTPPTAAQVSDQVWTELIADHSGVSGSTAEALASAGTAGDPWIAPLPGIYTTPGQAGNIVGTLLDAAVSTRMATTHINATAGAVDVCTLNSDMRGTESANTVVPDAAGTAAALHSTTDGLVTTIDTTMIKLGVQRRWTNNATGVGFDDVTVT